MTIEPLARFIPDLINESITLKLSKKQNVIKTF